MNDHKTPSLITLPSSREPRTPSDPRSGAARTLTSLPPTSTEWLLGAMAEQVGAAEQAAANIKMQAEAQMAAHMNQMRASGQVPLLGDDGGITARSPQAHAARLQADALRALNGVLVATVAGDVLDLGAVHEYLQRELSRRFMEMFPDSPKNAEELVKSIVDGLVDLV